MTRHALKDRMELAQLREKIEVGAPYLAILRFAVKKPLAFLAGQYTTLGLDVGEQFVLRAFSIASSPARVDELEFYAILVENGEFTPTLFTLKPGDTIYYLGAKGKFTLSRTGLPHLALIASGTGLAPFMSMLRYLVSREKAGEPFPFSRILVMHGVSHSLELGYREELLSLERRQGSFRVLYVPCVSRPTDGDGHFSHGRVNDLFRLVVGEPKSGKIDPVVAPGLSASKIQEWIPAGQTALFVCGNPEMIRDVQAVAEPHRYAEVYREDYW